jgi:hypothetical protein
MKNSTIFVVALLVGLSIAGSRFVYESSAAHLVSGDAQGGIWVFFSLVLSAGTFVLISLFCAFSLWSFSNHMRAVGCFWLLLLVFIGGHTVHRMTEIQQIRQALTDAKDPTTTPDRLRSLVGYDTGFGYEIDNRIASNPNTPLDVLRSLHEKPNQVGTDMSLAENPNTPDDILLELAGRDDSWKKSIKRRLEANPRYKELTESTEP